jgi:hypothetical protein
MGAIFRLKLGQRAGSPLVSIGQPVQPRPLPILVWLAASVLAGCETAQQRKAAENAAVNKQAAEEIARICALHGAEREEELKKLKAASRLDLYCPSD